MNRQYITLFAAPKAFSGLTGLIQDNALNSWQHIAGVEAILFGDDPGVAHAAVTRGFRHVPVIRCSEYGTPQLDDIFAQAQALAVTPFVCYINADIILPANFVDVVRGIASRLPLFLGIGRRWDVCVDEALDFSRNGYARLEELRRDHGRLYDPTGVDFFIFPRGMIAAMPPFCIGRPVWDNWLLWHVRQRRIPIVNTTEGLTVFHQDHSYGHVPGGDGKSWEGSPEATYNYSLVASLKSFNPTMQTVHHADLVYTSCALSGPNRLQRLCWDWTHSYFPRLRGILSAIAHRFLPF